MAGAKTQARETANGQPNGDTLAGAIAYEQAIADEAAKLWGDAPAQGLTPELFMRLRPLLRKPIPAALIEKVGVVTGKPYESTGIKSVQVQIDRMDAVLSPAWWRDVATYSDDGKLCHVQVFVGSLEEPMFVRESWGGVDRGSSQGNVRKGSYTNAAKLAFARVGPGWEIYIGAADFDPDTDEAAAKAQEGGGQEQAERKLPAEKVESLKTLVIEAGLKDHLAAKLRSCGVKAVEDLTVEQAISIYEWATEAKAGGS